VLQAGTTQVRVLARPVSSAAAHADSSSFSAAACWAELAQVTDVVADSQGGYAVATYVEQHAKRSIELTFDELDQGHWFVVTPQGGDRDRGQSLGEFRLQRRAPG
jgi:hypothetical protein